MEIRQKRQNYGINEFVLRAFDYNNHIVGRFGDQRTKDLTLRHYTCPSGASVCILTVHLKSSIAFMY